MMSQVDFESRKEAQSSTESGDEINNKSMGIKRTVYQMSPDMMAQGHGKHFTKKFNSKTHPNQERSKFKQDWNVNAK